MFLQRCSIGKSEISNVNLCLGNKQTNKQKTTTKVCASLHQHAPYGTQQDLKLIFLQESVRKTHFNVPHGENN